MNELAAYLNIAGLFLDIAGASLIFKFGLPERISRTGSSFLLLEGTDEGEVKRANVYDTWARAGLTLLILGFAVQAAGNSTTFWN
ncbi:MAG: hypothetical protein HQ511_11855 [Rhodospirillales bacterium]|nr:hypothetical protein [Rhodospirillales bacterium]